MDQVCIPGLVPSEDEPPELEVAVGGTTHPMAYRIETVTWGAELLLNERTEQLITFLADHDRRSSVQIGAPGDGVVPITFRKHCPALGPVVNSWTLSTLDARWRTADVRFRTSEPDGRSREQPLTSLSRGLCTWHER